MKFLHLAEDFSSKESKFQIIPISYECDVTYGGGADKGAQAILEASEHMEYYDEEFCVEPFEDGIYTHDLVTGKKFTDLTFNLLADSFPCFIGGDHAVTIAAVKEMEKVEDDFGVLIFDAHSDFRDSWNNSQYNHACVSKRLVANHKVGIVGVRSMDVDEDTLIETEENMSVLKMCDFSQEKFTKLLDSLPNKLYISVDVDCFDPSFIKHTGTPEPGGFYWREFIPLLKEAFSKKEIVGCDVVEFAPDGKLSASEAYSLARLIHKMFAMKKVR